MTVRNRDVAALFSRYAELLEVQDANPFRVRAYRNAAQTLEGLGADVSRMVADGRDLTELPGIGKDLAAKVREVVETGRLGALDDLDRSLPEHLADLTALPGLGPKRIRALYQALKVGSIDDLERAARERRIRTIEGFGAKTEQKILHAIEQHRDTGRRTLLIDAEHAAAPLLDHLKHSTGVERAVVAGSYRRRRETVGDLDVLVTARTNSDVVERFVAYDDVGEVVSHGTTRSTVILRGGLQVDLRVVPATSYGAALHYFTGSKAHNIAVRRLAQERGLKVNEYGVFRDDRQVAGRTEKSVYATVDLPYIEPELREDRGEIDAAREHRLPKLVRLRDIRGDLHCHSNATDGRHSAEEMALAARERGYDYVAITDHTKNVSVADGMDAKRFASHLDALEELNDRLEGIRVLKSAEVDILGDGTLDLPDRILDRLDLAVCAVHSRFDLPRRKQTERIIRAMDNRHCSVVAHPSGRLLGRRPPYDVDMERLIRAAGERGCALEVNAQPRRLGLTDAHVRQARDEGVGIVVSTDAHAVAQLDYMRFGVDQARRGWLEKANVLNTLSTNALLRALRRG